MGNNFDEYLIEKISNLYIDIFQKRQKATAERKIIFFEKKDSEIKKNKHKDSSYELLIRKYFSIFFVDDHEIIGSKMVRSHIKFDKVWNYPNEKNIENILKKDDYDSNKYFVILFHNKIENKKEIDHFFSLSDEEWSKQKKLLLEKINEIKTENIENNIANNWEKEINDWRKEKEIKNKIVNLLSNLSKKDDEKDDYDHLKKEIEPLISKDKFDETFNPKNKNQKEKLIEIILRENKWILGYSEENEVINNSNFEFEGIKWKPDLIIKKIDGTIDMYELKLPNEKILRYDRSHQIYYFSHLISRGLSQIEHQFSDLLKSNNKHIITKNDVLYLIIGNKREEIKSEITEKELKTFGNEENVKKQRKKAIELLRNSYKNLKIIFYDEIGTK